MGPEIESKPAENKATYDATKFTRENFDAVMEEHRLYRNKVAPYAVGTSTLSDVTASLNHSLGLNKSRSSYSRIWNGHISRESLGE